MESPCDTTATTLVVGGSPDGSRDPDVGFLPLILEHSIAM